MASGLFYSTPEALDILTLQRPTVYPHLFAYYKAPEGRHVSSLWRRQSIPAFYQKNRMVSDNTANIAMSNHLFASTLWVKKNGFIWLELNKTGIVKLKQFFHLNNTIMWEYR